MAAESFDASQKSLNSKPLFAMLFQEFQQLIPDDEAAIDAICRAGNIDTTRCRYCKSENVTLRYAGRALRCNDCKGTAWFLAGTFFARARKVVPWLGTIFMIGRGVKLTPGIVHRLFGIAVSTAAKIIKKVATVIERSMDCLEVYSGMFLEVFIRRSRETPAREHPVGEQRDFEARAVGENGPFPGFHYGSLPQPATEGPVDDSGVFDLSFAGGAPEQECATKIYQLLSETPVCVDELIMKSGVAPADVLTALTMLELSGSVVRLPGNHYRRRPTKTAAVRPCSGSELNGLCALSVMEFIRFIRSPFQGISRKYLQKYLALYWCYLDRTRWTAGSLLEACARFRTVSHQELIDYVSPLFVKLPQPFA